MGDTYSKCSSSIVHTPQIETYDHWASTYDTDGNFLQALDSTMMPDLLQTLQANLPPLPKLQLIDLGCGTGRNTRLLLSIPHAEIWGLDNSTNMLAQAEQKAKDQEWVNPSITPADCSLGFKRFDVNSESDLDSFLDLVGPGEQDGVISTLLLEHVELERFFYVAQKLLQPEGVLLVTNMHEDMGRTTQAGFKDRETGMKVQTVSYIHTVEQVMKKAEGWGFEVVREPVERALRKEDLEVVGERGGKWVGVNVWFGVVFRKRKT